MSLLIFDLDGTLIDSRLDLANAVNATRAEMQLSPLAHETISSYVGNGASVLIQKAMGPEATEDQLARALAFFIDYYGRHAVDATVLYPGVRESLEALHAAGMTLAVFTNKPVNISRRIMEHFGLASMMFRIYGGNSFERKKPDAMGIERLREETGTARKDTWMVGDSYVDVQTARNAGVPCCGVSYGFAPESLIACPPDVLVERMEEFAARLIPGFIAK